MKKVFVGLCLLILAQSCVIDPDPIDVEIGQADPELVINSYWLPPSVFAIVLTQSFSALELGGDTLSENEIDFIDNLIVDPAEVILRFDDKEVELTKVLPGTFGSVEVELEPYVEYELEVTDLSTDDRLTAMTTVLPQIPIGDISYDFFELGDSSESIVRLKYVINDPPDEDNYYLLGQVLNSDLQIGGLSDLVMSNSNYQIISDKEFPDETVIEYEFNTTFVRGDTLTASLSNITEQYYDYLIAYKRLGNIFSGFLSEPVRSLPSNVEGGLGYFNLALPDYKEVILE